MSIRPSQFILCVNKNVLSKSLTKLGLFRFFFLRFQLLYILCCNICKTAFSDGSGTQNLRFKSLNSCQIKFGKHEEEQSCFILLYVLKKSYFEYPIHHNLHGVQTRIKLVYLIKKNNILSSGSIVEIVQLWLIYMILKRTKSLWKYIFFRIRYMYILSMNTISFSIQTRYF